MAETEKEKQERERQERERQRQQKKTTEDEAEDRVGEPMREDDGQNQFRAPDNKPVGGIYGEDATQPRAGTAEEPRELPPDTHAQKPGPQAKESKEDKDKHNETVVTRR